MYAPMEDSFFLSEILTNYLGLKKMREFVALDIGSGSGIQAETLSKFSDKKNILCADIDEEALKEARKKGFKARKSDLFSNINKKFDIITFNPPYLPVDKYDKGEDTAGGKKGDETILEFLKQAKKHLNKHGKIFLLVSNLTPLKRIEIELKKQKLKIEKKFMKKIFFEELYVWIIG